MIFRFKIIDLGAELILSKIINMGLKYHLYRIIKLGNVLSKIINMGLKYHPYRIIKLGNVSEASVANSPIPKPGKLQPHLPPASPYNFIVCVHA